jgi:iron(III) transport system permease protein
VVGVLIPGFFTAMGWLFLFQPDSGIVNRLLMDAFGLASAPFNVVSMPAMGFVQGLSLASVVFAMTCTTFRTMDGALEDAARASGATFLGQIRRVTMPLAWPSILAATLYVAIIAFGAFDVPAIIGLSAREFTFSTFLYFNVNPQAGMPKYGLVAAFSTFMILVGILLSWAYSRVLKRGNRYRVVTGKNYKSSVVKLGGWVWAAWGFLGLYFLISKIMPLLAVVWTSLLPYLEPPSAEAVASITLANLTGLPWKLVLDAMLYTAVLSWVAIRSKYRFRAVYDYVAFIPHAVPSLILGVGALLLALFVLPQSLRLYGSVTLLAIVMSLAMVSFGTRMTNSGLLQIHPELEEAASVSGAGTFTTLRRVLVPLLRPTFQNGWLWIAILTFRELTLPLILFSPTNMTLAVAVWTLWSGGLQGQAAMITVLMLVAVTPLAVLYMRLTRKRGGAAL